MLILLPLIAFALSCLLFRRTSPSGRSWRTSCIQACVLWGTFVTISTESLSLVSSLNTAALALAWLAFIGTLAFLLYKHKRRPPAAVAAPRYPLFLTVTENVLIFSAICIIITVGAIAVIAAPNTWDSMSYHMPRVAHWVQNNTVAFYPSAITRQLWASPWAEYAVAQLQILSQGDRFANMVQWWSMTGSIIGVSLIAQLLGAARRGQILSAVICASLPVGILQGSSTQNDYATAFWIVACVYFGLKLLKEPRYSTALWWALAFGLAFLTKTTTVTFLAPFILWTVTAGLRKYGKTFLPVFFILAATPLALNLPQCARNYQLNGNIFSLASESKGVKNETLSLQGAASNAIRYAGLNLAVGHAPFDQAVESAVAKAHQMLNWDVSDQRFTNANNYRIVFSLHEDSSGNTAAAVTFFLTVIVFVLWVRLFPVGVLIYLISLLSAFLLFCLAVKWQPWGNRLLLPLTVLAAPFMGFVLEKINPRTNAAIAVALIALSLPWVFNNTSRPIFSKDNSIFTKARGEQYFANSSGMYFSYQRAVEELQNSGCRNIGLKLTINGWEYPLWALRSAPHNKNMRMEHISVDNVSKKLDYPLGAFDPCAIVDDDGKKTTRLVVNGQAYTKTNQWAFLSIFRKDTDGKIGKMTRNSYFAQMIQSSVRSDQLLMQGNSSQEAVLKSFQLRRLAVEQAKLLNIAELDSLYRGLGSSIQGLFITGNELILSGLTEQDTAKINQGQALLNQWNAWLQKNIEKLQTVLQ